MSPPSDAQKSPSRPTTTEWRELVAQAFGGADAIRSLTSTSLDGIEIEPLYRADEALAERAFDLFGTSSAAWEIGSLVTTNDPAIANRQILEDLEGGAGAVTLRLAAPGQSGLPTRLDAVSAALDGVHLGLVPVGFLAGDQYFGALQCLMALWDQHGIAAASRRARLNADPLGTLAGTGALEQDLYSTLEVLGHFIGQNIDNMLSVSLLLADGRPWHDAGASEAEELAATLATAVEYLRSAKFEGVPATRLLPRLSIALGADADVLLSIAKFRAMRQLLRRTALSLEAGETWQRVAIEATTSKRMQSAVDCETNILRNTLAVAAAALGGANTITALPHTVRCGEADAGARRIARNIGVVLQEEAHLDRVVDPAGGSGAVEALTNALARKAWEIFQTIEAEGGMAKALLTGSLIARIHATAGRRRQAIASGETKLVGVNAFAVNGQHPPVLPPHPAPAPIVGGGERIAPLAPFTVD